MVRRLAIVLALAGVGCTTAPRFAAPEPVDGRADLRQVLVPTWSEPLGSAVATAVAPSPEGGIVVGVSAGDPDGPSHANLVKYDRGGDLVWSSELDVGLRVGALDVDADGRTTVLANATRPGALAGGRILTVDRHGLIVGSLVFAGAIASSFARARSGGFVIAGSFEAPLDADGVHLEPLPDEPPPHPGWFSPHEPTSFLAEITPEGRVAWARVLEHGRGSTLAALGGGDFVEVGSTFQITARKPRAVTGIWRGHVSRRGPDGALRWSRELTSTEGVYLGPVAVDALGGVVVAGSLSGTLRETDGVVSRGEDDALVARFAPDGELRWATSFGGAGSDGATAVAVTPEGRTFVAGTLAEPGAEEQPRTSPFVVELDPTGRVVSSQHFGFREARSLIRGAVVDRDREIVLAGAFGAPSYLHDPAEGFVVWLARAERRPRVARP